MSRERLVGLACAGLSVLLFASFTLVSRLGFTSQLHLVDLAALRFAIGGLLLFPALLRADLKRVGWRNAAALAVFGGVGFALLAYAGFSLAPASHGAVLLHGTLPLWTYVLRRATGSSRPVRHRSIGVLLIAGGVALMVSDSLAIASARQLLGDMLLLAASLFWSAYGVLSRRLGRGHNRNAPWPAVRATVRPVRRALSRWTDHRGDEAAPCRKGRWIERGRWTGSAPGRGEPGVRSAACGD
jgi:drug/metabolite transporter (DMT)-like permease